MYIESVNPKGNQPWIFIERAVGEAEATILWPPDVRSQPIGNDPDAGKDWRQKKERHGRKWDGIPSHSKKERHDGEQHNWLNGHEFEQTPGDSGGQSSLTCFTL